MFKRILIALVAAVAPLAVANPVPVHAASGCTTQVALDANSQVIGARAKCDYLTGNLTVQEGIAATIICDYTYPTQYQSRVRYLANTWSEFVFCPINNNVSPPYRGHAASVSYRVVNALSCHQPLTLAYCGGTPGGPPP